MIRRFYQIHSFLEELGISKKDCFVFGGTIRDRLLNRNVVDIDIVVAGSHSFEGLLERASRRARIVLVKEEFSFVKLIIQKENATVIDLQIAEDIHGFLASRDFTINSLAVRADSILRFMSVPEKGYLIDLNGGLSDLSKGVLRTCSERSFVEDPIRIFRAAYYASKMKLYFHESLVEQAGKCLNLLKTVKKEKLRENFLSLAFEEPFKFFCNLNTLGVSKALFGCSISPERLKKIKEISEKLAENNASRSEKSALRVAILAEAGILDAPLFAGTFSKKTVKKALAKYGIKDSCREKKESG